MKKGSLLFLFIFCLYTSAYPQLVNSSDNKFIKGFIIKSAPSISVYGFKTAWLAPEFLITKHLSLQPEIGYIYDSKESDFNTNKLNYQIRANVRLYQTEGYKGAYYGFDIRHKAVNYDGRIKVYEVFEQLFESSYFVEYMATVSTTGIYIKGGYQFFIAKKLAVDFHLGLGYNHVNTSFKKIAKGHQQYVECGTTYSNLLGILINEERSETLFPIPTIAAGLHVGYRIW